MAEESEVFVSSAWTQFHKELLQHAERHPGTVITQEVYSNIVAWKQVNAPKGQRGQVGTAHERKTWRDKGYELQVAADGETRLMMPDRKHGRLLEVIPLPRIAQSLHHVHAILIGHHGQNKTKQKVRELYYGIPVEPLVPMFINCCRVCGFDVAIDDPQISRRPYRAPSEEGSEGALAAASRAERVPLPEKTRLGRRVAPPTRFVDGNDDHVGVSKRNFAEFARVQADGVVKVEFQSRESPTTRDPAAKLVKTMTGHGVVALPSKHRRKFAAPKRAAL